MYLYTFFAVPANGNFTEEVGFVKAQEEKNSIEFPDQRDEFIQSQMAKKNRNHAPTPQSES